MGKKIGLSFFFKRFYKLIGSGRCRKRLRVVIFLSKNLLRSGNRNKEPFKALSKLIQRYTGGDYLYYIYFTYCYDNGHLVGVLGNLFQPGTHLFEGGEDGTIILGTPHGRGAKGWCRMGTGF